LFYAIPTNADNSAVGGPITIAGFDKGIVRQFVGDNYKFRMVGRYTDEQPGHRGDGTIKQKSVVALSAPYDLAGLGVYTVQSAQGKADEAYVYVKSIRRIKRTAGAAVWMDNQPQMDMLNDDNNGIDSYPLWYSDFRILGKRTILAVSYLEPMMTKHYEDLIEKSSYWKAPRLQSTPTAEKFSMSALTTRSPTPVSSTTRTTNCGACGGCGSPSRQHRMATPFPPSTTYKPST
jgi:hypothetical protein